MIVRDSVSLIDASITCSRRALAHRHEALADPVEHDDGVVQRVADDGQDRRQRRQVERHLGHREEAEDDDRVVQRRDDGADAELPLEAQPDVEQDEEEREQHRERALLGELRADLRAHDLGAAQLDARFVGLDRRQHARGRARCCPCPPRGSRRTSTSRGVPKLCTDGVAETRLARATPRTFSRSAACGKLSSSTTPPVKSMPKLRPRTRQREQRAEDQRPPTPRTTACASP